MRVAYFDLETSNLKGDVGRILCGSILIDGEMTTYANTAKNKANDGKVAERIANKLYKDADMLVSWYGKGFDMPFLRTRLIANGLPSLPPMLHLDGCWFFKGWRGLGPRNAKLSTAAEFFGLGERKMDVDVSVWIDAALGGDKKALDILVERCESDVRILKQVIDRLLDTGLVKNIGVY